MVTVAMGNSRDFCPVIFVTGQETFSVLEIFVLWPWVRIHTCDLGIGLHSDHLMPSWSIIQTGLPMPCPCPSQTQLPLTGEWIGSMEVIMWTLTFHTVILIPVWIHHLYLLASSMAIFLLITFLQEVSLEYKSASIFGNYEAIHSTYFAVLATTIPQQEMS